MTSNLGGLRGGVEEQEPFWPCTTEVRRAGGERSLEGKHDCRLGCIILEMPIRHSGDVKKQLETGVWSSELEREI